MKKRENISSSFEHSSRMTSNSGAGALLQNAIILEIMEWMDYETACQQLARIGLSFDLTSPFVLIRVSINDIGEFENSHEQFQCLVATERAFLEGVGKVSTCIHASTPGKDIVYLARPFEGVEFSKELIADIQEQAFKNEGISTNVVFSGMICFTDLHETNSEMEGIQDKLKIENQRMAIVDCRIYAFSSSLSQENTNHFGIVDLDELLFKAVEAGEPDALYRQIEAVLGGDHSVSEKLEFYHSLASCLISYLRRHHVDDVFLTQKKYLDVLCGYSETEDISFAMKGLIADIATVNAKRGEQKRDDEIILDIDNFIRAHITSPMSLSTIASAFYMNASYLSRFYKSKVGHTISETIAQNRIARAKRLLMDSSLRINEIAYETGFESSSYFARAFKKSEGLSPQDWRLHHIQGKK